MAALARLKFSPEEEEVLTQQLDRILQYMEKLNQLDTSNVAPLAHVVDIVNAFREDGVVHAQTADTLLVNAPAKEKNFLKVPKIIE